MNIGIDTNCLSLSEKTGLGRYIANLMKQFLNIGSRHNYYLYSALKIDEPIRNEFSVYKNVYFREDSFPIRTLWQQFFLGHWLKKDKLNIYLSINGLLPIRCSVPAVSIVHDLIWYHFPQTEAYHIRLINRFALKRSVRQAKHCICDSEVTKRDLMKYAQIGEEKITVIYAGVDDRFKPQSQEQILAVCKQNGIVPPYILFVGSLKPHKNLERLIKAYQKFCLRLEEKREKIPELVLVGFEERRTAPIYRLIKELRLENRIKFTGYVRDSELVTLYSGATIFVFPSLIEGFGLPLLEAQACATPVICSNAGSLPEVGGESVLYFDPYNIEEMAEQLTKLYLDKALQQTLRQKGFENLTRFSWQKTAHQLLSILTKSAEI